MRLHGEKAEFTGPVAGMSGSPVYYNGKIIGSLSYSLGNFLKEPLMGITPIREMLEIFDKEKRRDTELAAMGSREHMQRFVDMALALEPVEWEAFLPQRPSLQAGGFGVTQLPVLLNLSGFSDHSFELAQKLFAPLGFSAVRGGGSGSQNQGMDLVPGAPISAVLLTGDMSIDATGTVTYRDGDRVLAFGHPFFDNGPIELPMAQSHIITTISSAMASQKLGLTGKLVGTLRQDRTTGVMGILGPIPRMTEVTMRYRSEDGQQSQFSFSVAREKSIASISPLILRIALISALESARLSTGFNSLRLKGVVVLDDGEKLILDNLFGVPAIAGVFLSEQHFAQHWSDRVDPGGDYHQSVQACGHFARGPEVRIDPRAAERRAGERVGEPHAVCARGYHRSELSHPAVPGRAVHAKTAGGDSGIHSGPGAEHCGGRRTRSDPLRAPNHAEQVFRQFLCQPAAHFAPGTAQRSPVYPDSHFRPRADRQRRGTARIAAIGAAGAGRSQQP
ncbi:MAG: hypothetical protein Q9P14_04825 [candidate division KSB1 bacterium]|nr:hypothetical protein [candidate division KSB1 bacterium]